MTVLSFNCNVERGTAKPTAATQRLIDARKNSGADWVFIMDILVDLQAELNDIYAAGLAANQAKAARK